MQLFLLDAIPASLPSSPSTNPLFLHDFSSHIWVICWSAAPFARTTDSSPSADKGSPLCLFALLPWQHGECRRCSVIFSSHDDIISPCREREGRPAFNRQPFPSATQSLARKQKGKCALSLLLSLFDQVLGNSWASRDAMQPVLWPYKVVTQWGCLSHKCVPLSARDNSGELRLWQQRNPLLWGFF